MSQPAFSAKEFQRLGEIMHDARSVDRSDRVWQLVSAVQKVIPYEFSGCGAVDLLYGIDPSLGHSTYPRQFCQLYMGQGLAVNPAVNRLITSGQTVTSSADEPTATITGERIDPAPGQVLKAKKAAAILKTIERAYASPDISYDDIMEGFDESEIEVAITEDDDSMLDLEKASEDAPVIRLCNAILLNAIKQGASDIHVEPYERVLRVRYRDDGVLQEEMTPPIKLKNAIASRLKIMSSLDIAERRLPQDGRIKLKLGKGREMDFRVSVLPTLFGEKVVLRLLDKSNLSST